MLLERSEGYIIIVVNIQLKELLIHRLYVVCHHDDVLHYRVTTPTSDPVEDRHTLEQYFRPDLDLTALYTQ